ncbi:hypothetical protein E4U26_006860 [Claviceps purpurea]|nr:hypothetical protein E4U26_006860 [Claviceps purpurea]
MLLWEKKVADAQQVFTIRNACFIKYTPASPCRGRPWPQAEDLKPWTKFPSISMDSMMSIRITTFCQQETDAELAAAFFSDNRTVAAMLEALDESPEPKIVEKSPSSRAGMIQGNLRSREDRVFMTTDGSDAPPAATGRPRLGIGRALADMTLPEFELYFSSWFYDRRRE